MTNEYLITGALLMQTAHDKKCQPILLKSCFVGI